MGAQSWGQRPLTPRPPFGPLCTKLCQLVSGHRPLGYAHLCRPKSFGTNSCVRYKLLRTVQPKTRSRPKDRPTIVGAAHCTAGASHPAPGPHPNWACPVIPTPLCPPNLAKPTALCTVAPNRLGQTSAYSAVRLNFCVLYSSHPIRRSPNSILLFLTPGPLHRRPCVGGGHSLEPTAQVGPASLR